MDEIINRLEELHKELNYLEKAVWDEFWRDSHEMVHVGIAIHAIETAARCASRAAYNLRDLKEYAKERTEK